MIQYGTRGSHKLLSFFFFVSLGCCVTFFYAGDGGVGTFGRVETEKIEKIGQETTSLGDGGRRQRVGHPNLGPAAPPPDRETVHGHRARAVAKGRGEP